MVSVPSYTIHRDAAVWGEDPDVYRPERWFEEERAAAIQKTFNPFSVGPRCVAVTCELFLLPLTSCPIIISACVGRNLASLELQIIVASILRKFHFVLEKPGNPVRVISSSSSYCFPHASHPVLYVWFIFPSLSALSWFPLLHADLF